MLARAVAWILVCVPVGALALSSGLIPDVAYVTPLDDPADRRRLDIHGAAPGATARPIVLYVHGGGWLRGDRSAVGDKARWSAARGYLFVSVGYRLLPEVRHPGHTADLAAAIAWLHRHAGEYGGDPERLFLVAHSVGAHLAALVATDERFLGAHGLPLSALAGVATLDTNAFDLPALLQALPADRRLLYRLEFGSAAGDLVAASPRRHVAPGKGIPPFLLLTAGDSTTRAQAELQRAALVAAGVPVAVHHFADQTHGSLNARLGRSGHPPTAALAKFLEDPP